MINKLGVIVQNLNNSQSNFFLIQALNRLNQEEGIDCCIFYEQCTAPMIPPLFSIFHMNEIYDFSGPVISTYMLGTKRLIDSPGPRKKFMYLWAFEWAKIPQFAYNNIKDIYLNPEINLIVRSQHHAHLVENCFKKPAFIFDNWDKDALTKLCHTT